MLRRKSRIGWAFTTWICCFAVSAGVSFGEVPKTVRVVLSGADAQSASVAYEVNGQLVKLLPASDGNRYVSTSDSKLSLHVEHPGLGASVTSVALPEVSTVSVQVDLGAKTSAHVVESGKSAFRPVPAADSPTMSTIAGSSPVTGQQGAAPVLNITDYFAQLQANKTAGPAAKGQSNPTAGPRGGPANDACAAAIPVGDGATGFDTTGADTDGPALPAGCEEGFGLSLGQDIWFCYTATCDGTATASLCGSGYDTRMAVYNGCACPPTTLLSCNDDFAGCGGNGLQSQTSFPVTNGNSYLIRVGGFGTAQGAGTLNISCGGGGGGGGGMGGSDDCTMAEAISGVGLYSFDTSAAATDGSPHGACLAFGEDQIENDIWYCWTSDCDGTVRVETCGLTTVDTRIAVYSGCNVCPPTDAELLACNDDTCSLQSRVQFAAVNGQTYLIRIGNYPGAGGGIGQFNVTCLPPAMEICMQPAGNCQGRDLSDARTSTRGAFTTAEDLVPASSGNITGLCWWGTYASGAASADSFEVCYYADAGGFPGAAIACFSQSLGSLTVGGPSDTGNQIAGIVPEFGYTGSHAAVAVTGGQCIWVEITNGTTGNTWFWEISPPGSGRAVQHAGSPGGYSPADILLGVDLAVCLDIALGDPAPCLPPPAMNDDCGDCDAITGEGIFAFDNSGATTDGPTHAACFFFGEDQIENDVWFCWTASCDGSVQIQTCGLTGVDTKMAVYNGLTCPTDDTTLIVCNDDACGLQSSVTFTATSGQNYLIRIGNYPGAAPGIGSFNVSCLGVAPCNQPAANCHTRDVSDARNSTRGVFTAADDFTPNMSGSITDICFWGTYFDGAGDCSSTGPDAFVVKYYADNGSNLPGALLATFSQSGATLTVSPKFPTGNLIAGLVPEYEYSASHAAVPVSAGTCYWIEITNLNSASCSWFWGIDDGTTGNGRLVQDGTPPNGYDAADAENGPDLAFCLNLALGDDSACAPPPPDNDDCAMAQLIACNSSVSADNSSATTDINDPLFSCAFFGPQQGFGTLWYTFVATDTEAFVSLCNSSATDTLLAVYSGTCGNLTELACNDDASCGPIGLGSELCVTGLTVGNTYYIQAASFSGADTGAITLDLTCPCPEAPPGDLCDEPVGPLAIPSVTMGTTVGTSIDTAPFCGTSISAPGVWYTVIGTGNTITASTCTGTSYDSKLNVYCGPCNNLTCVVGLDDFCGLQSQVSWCSQSGALYRILVQGFSGATGAFELTLTDNGIPCTASVLCAAVGGCCTDGVCAIRTEEDCAALGGDYLGDNTDCSLVGGMNREYNSTVNQAIPDANAAGISNTINVPESFTVEDVNVDFSATHTFVGDFCVTLTHGATSVNLILRPGDGLNDCHAEAPFGCGENNYNAIILDDEGTLPIEDRCVANATSPPNYVPNNPLSAFDGMDAAGPWILTVSDNAGQDTGTFNSWSLHFASGGSSPCVMEPCDTCPPGTIAIVDGGGDFSGWCASVSHPGSVNINVVDVDTAADRATITLDKLFNQPPGFGGLVPAILIDFVQVCPDSQTANTIVITSENISNQTGVNWLDFHWLLFDGPDAWFDRSASGFSVLPFQSKLFSKFLDSPTNNKAREISAYNGVVPNGGLFQPGGGAAPIQIGVDLSGAARVSFTLKEWPTLDGIVIAGGCCLGLDCVTLTPSDCAASAGRYLGDGVACTSTACLPQNDECNNCSPVTTGVPVNGTTEGATGTDITACAFNDTIDVWHCWTADCTGTATFDLCGSAYDTTIAVFSACTGGTQLACNDDFNCDGVGANELQSRATLSVTNGTTYYIRVSGFNGTTGNYTLNVSCAPGGGTGSGRRNGPVQATGTQRQ